MVRWGLEHRQLDIQGRLEQHLELVVPGVVDDRERHLGICQDRHPSQQALHVHGEPGDKSVREQRLLLLGRWSPLLGLRVRLGGGLRRVGILRA